MDNQFAKMTKNLKPNKLIVDSLDFVKRKENAIDIGAGSLRDAKCLANSGFKDIIALDKNFSGVTSPNNSNIELIESDIVDYKMDKESFDLVVAINSLPFVSDDKFSNIIEKILNSIKVGGVICATLFGPKDDWSKEKKM